MENGGTGCCPYCKRFGLSQRFCGWLRPHAPPVVSLRLQKPCMSLHILPLLHLPSPQATQSRLPFGPVETSLFCLGCPRSVRESEAVLEESVRGAPPLLDDALSWFSLGRLLPLRFLFLRGGVTGSMLLAAELPGVDGSAKGAANEELEPTGLSRSLKRRASFHWCLVSSRASCKAAPWE